MSDKKFPTLRQADFIDRNNFADFLNRTGRVEGAAVEIGTHRGEWAFIFLYNWEGPKLYCVDPWATPPGYEEQAQQLLRMGGEKDRSEDMRFCKEHLRGFGSRVSLYRGTSKGASIRLDGEFDFVYIDGDHRYKMVQQDLRLWWPKVRSGGVLAGHDFMSHGADPWNDHVQPAVMEFAQEIGLPIWIVTEPTCMPWSWYLEKP